MTEAVTNYEHCGRQKGHCLCAAIMRQEARNHACGGLWSFGEFADVKPWKPCVRINSKLIEVDAIGLELERQRKAEDPMEGMEGTKHEIYRTAKALAEAIKAGDSSQMVEFQTTLLELFRLRKKRKKAKRKQLRDAIVKAACDAVDRLHRDGIEKRGPLVEAVDDYCKSIVKGCKDETKASKSKEINDIH